MAARMRPTGGQTNVAGILYQMLTSLAAGLEAAVADDSMREASEPLVLHLEPFDGGDVQIRGRQRLVVQVKMRASHLRWTPGELIGDVLADLYKSVGMGAGDQYQFVTDNDSGSEEFRRFLLWVRDEDTQSSGPQKFKLGKYGRRVAAEEVVVRIANQLDPKRLDDRKIMQFLKGFSIVRLSRAELIRSINSYLRELVDKPEDLRHKRKQLIGELIDLGAAGRSVTATQLLEGAELDPRRLALPALLPRQLRHALGLSFISLNYDPSKDIRGPLPQPVSPFTVLRGESGLGKTWRLCAMARAMSEAGKLVILVRAAADIDALRARTASSVWNPIYSTAAPLPSVAERLRPKFRDERGVWLTVFIDDLNDPELARSIVEDHWASLGIDVVTASQPPTADWLRGSIAVPETVEVPGFNIDELIRYLQANGVDYAELDNDVLELLFKPVLARLFCQLPHGISVRAETEYELLNSFWVQAATGNARQIHHPFDLDRLQLVIGDMLSPPCTYPWPPSAFVRTLDDAAIHRLMACGIVELDGDRRLSMTHDRLLNWAMAAHLGGLAVDENLDAPQLLALVQRVEGLHTLAGLAIGSRLGYVLMDLLWMMLRPGRRAPQQVAAFVLAYMRTPEFDSYNHGFFCITLPTLGPRAVPMLQAIAEESFSGGKEQLWPAWIAEALRKVADDAWEEVREAATALFRSGDSSRIEIALRVIGKVGAGDLVSELFDLNMQRARILQAADGEQLNEMRIKKENVFAAFARSAEIVPDWLDGRIGLATDSAEAEQLLWALLQFRRSFGLPIWRKRRAHLFATIHDGKRVLPRAVRVFGEQEDLLRLPSVAPAERDALYEATVFDAVARLRPTEALATLVIDEGGEEAFGLWGTEGWWLPGLHYRAGGPALGSALRARARRRSRTTPGQALAQVYSAKPELIDAASVDFILEELETLLEAASNSTEEGFQLSYGMLTLLSSFRSRESLERLANRRGTRLEQALVDLAAARGPSSSRVVDREGEMIARILAVMAGEGYERLVLSQIRSTGRTTAEYGFQHAFWTSSTAVGDQLAALATSETSKDEERPFYLMQALAVHERDAGLARLIEDSSPVFTHAVAIRQGRQTGSLELIELIRQKAASPELAERLQAVDMSHFLEADEAIELTRPLIASATPGDPITLRLLHLYVHRGRYEPALLPRLAPLLTKADDTAAMAAHYLAQHGDRDGRTAALLWLGEHGEGELRWDVAQVALALLDHEATRNGALSYLQEIRDGLMSFGQLKAEVLNALAQSGDQRATEQLANLAYGRESRDLNAVAAAVRLIAAKDPHIAFQAARRLFAKSGHIESAKLLMVSDPAKGVAELMTAYVGANLPKRRAIARSLRWGASKELLVPAVTAMAGAVMEQERKIAAEIAGWLPHKWDLPWLKQLAWDAVQSVEEMALRAIWQRKTAAEAQNLMEDIPGLPKARQWAYLRAVIDMTDPQLLLHENDPLDIRGVLKRLPEEFRIEAQRQLDRRRQDVERRERDLARREIV